ncbi:MAG: hypothetical protein N2578_04890, partial [Bdellovibrionaceae bacterium]|nr:hypothetical protein [Pseudobdellovibrionaceae bacterium]
MTTEPVSQDKIKAQETAQSMTRIVLSQFLEHKAAVVGAVLIFILSVVALSADWISALTGLNPNTQNVNARYLHPFSRSEMDSGSKENLTERWIAENPDAAREIISLIENQQLVPSTGEDALYELVLLERSEALQKASQIEHPGAESLRSLIDSFSRYHI